MTFRQRIIEAWKILTGKRTLLSTEEKKKRMDEIIMNIDPVFLNQEASRVLELAKMAGEKQGQLIEEYFIKLLHSMFPDYLVDIYLEQKTPIPYMRTEVSQFGEVTPESKSEMSATEIKFYFKETLVGHAVFRATFENNMIVHKVEEKITIGEALRP